MAKSDRLSGLPNNLLSSFFSTEQYFEIGYMSDWILNGCRELKISKMEFDLLNKIIIPEKLQIKPVISFLPYLVESIHRTLLKNGFEKSFIQDARFFVTIQNDDTLICKARLIDINNKQYLSKDYVEKKWTDFSVLKSKYVVAK